MNPSTNQVIPLSLSRKRVGLLLSPKKKRKSVFDAFLELCSETGIELIEIDLNVPLEDQGPFDIILQKITDYMAQATNGDEHALKTIKSFECYLNCHPEVTVLDPLDCVQKLCNRLVSYQVMKQCQFVEDGIRTYVPNFVRIDSSDVDENIRRIRAANVQFPMVCKPLIGHGSDESHRMSLIFTDDGLKDVSPPCVVQHFVNHNAILYKVFVAANRYHTVHRPSIKNFYKKKDEQPKTIFFNSHDVSKADASSHLSQLDEIDNTSKVTPTDDVVVAKIVRKLQQKLGLSMFGIDIVIEKGTTNHVVIDINYFPGYEGAPSFPADMIVSYSAFHRTFLGTKMGPSYANLFVGFGEVEEQIFQQYSGPKPELFGQYIDDCIGNSRVQFALSKITVNFIGERLTYFPCKFGN